MSEAKHKSICYVIPRIGSFRRNREGNRSKGVIIQLVPLYPQGMLPNWMPSGKVLRRPLDSRHDC